MDSESIDVHLHIYDLTRGMAQVMSAALLGIVVIYIFAIIACLI